MKLLFRINVQKCLIFIEKAASIFYAFSPDVPSCITAGETIDETLRNIHEALKLYIKENDCYNKAKDRLFYVKEGILDTNELVKSI